MDAEKVLNWFNGLYLSMVKEVSDADISKDTLQILLRDLKAIKETSLYTGLNMFKDDKEIIKLIHKELKDL